MKDGYRIFWSEPAKSQLQSTIEFLVENWTEKELQRFFQALEHTIDLISQNPELFQSAEQTQVRRAIILKLNTLFYRVNNDTVEILSFFSNRQGPKKIKILRN